MPTAKEPCPLCLAAPADWVDDPHRSQDGLFLALADLRRTTGVGERPMLSELPRIVGDRLRSAAVIMAALRDLSVAPAGTTVFAKDMHDWRQKALSWLLAENHAETQFGAGLDPLAREGYVERLDHLESIVGEWSEADAREVIEMARVAMARPD